MLSKKNSGRPNTQVHPRNNYVKEERNELRPWEVDLQNIQPPFNDILETS